MDEIEKPTEEYQENESNKQQKKMNGINTKHTDRIDAFLKEVPEHKSQPMDSPIIFKKGTFAMEQRCKKLLAKIRHKLKS